VRELYAELLHTTSTQEGFEYSIRPWGDRDFRGNLTPHGWFAAEYRNVLRSILVRETDSDLHLLSAVSPAWTGVGKHISVQNVPTYFGKISFTLSMPSETTAVLDLRTSYRNLPKQLVLHQPWFYAIDSAEADGKPLTVQNDELVLPVHSTRITLHWHRRKGIESLSYDESVEKYKSEYRRRYEEWITKGKSFDWRPSNVKTGSPGAGNGGK